MTTAFDLIDPPELVAIEYYSTEDFHSRPFVHFHWHDADYWLLGQMRWRNIMSAGEGLLRLPRGKKVHRSGMIVYPDNKPATFLIGSPRTRQGTLKRHIFVFSGFHPHQVVNMDFVREENRRIKLLPYGEKREKIKRPPAGHVV